MSKLAHDEVATANAPVDLIARVMRNGRPAEVYAGDVGLLDYFALQLSVKSEMTWCLADVQQALAKRNIPIDAIAQVEGNLLIERNDHWPNLTVVRGALTLGNRVRSEMIPKIERVDGNLSMRAFATTHALRQVSGSAALLRDSTARNLSLVYGDLLIDQDAKAPNLLAVGGSLSIDVDAYVPKLRFIGGRIDEYLEGTKTASRSRHNPIREHAMIGVGSFQAMRGGQEWQKYHETEHVAALLRIKADEDKLIYGSDSESPETPTDPSLWLGPRQ